MVVTENTLVEGRNALNRTGREIQQAAKYCSGNYLTAAANGHRRAIDETINYATQSLGTMIHYINHLASAFLVLLDERTEKLTEVEAKVAEMTMRVKIRREKVARKAIGSCTTSKVPIKCTLTKIRQDPPMEYIRRPIDYSILDHIGHQIRSQESVTGPYGAPVVHAQTLTRRGSTTAHQINLHGNTINPKVIGMKVDREYTVTSVAAPEYQSGTVGRAAGIYRTAIVGQYGNPYGGQQQVLLPVSINHPLTTAGGSGGVGGGYASNLTGLLSGPSHRPSSSSSNQQRAATGYAPSAAPLTQPQHQGIPFQHPSQEQAPPPPSQQAAMFVRQHSEPGSMLIGSVQHRFPAQYHEPPQISLQRTADIKNSVPSSLPPPPSEISPNSKLQIPIQLDGGSCGTGGVTSPPQGQLQQEYGKNSGSGGVDLSCLQPSPMDQLRPRHHSDPPWAPHHYIQKVITVYEYTADKSDELTFGENELIYVIKKNDDGWWEGIMMNGTTGLFPGNYVEDIS